MKREEKNAQSRQRILDAALLEFSEKGYEGASLNTVCAQHGISKGVIYHHFRDKDEIYLLCVGRCFDEMTAYLRQSTGALEGSTEQKLFSYFDARLRFFSENPWASGIFVSAAIFPPPQLSDEIALLRAEFDALNISALTGLLDGAALRGDLRAPAIVEDFRLYMDFFNMRFRADFAGAQPSRDALREHEERCRRQLDILLHGVLGDQNEDE